jgi:hypothetical protein
MIVPALSNGRRVPVPFTDEEGKACLRVPLDNNGEAYALVQREDYLHIVRALGWRGAWCLGGPSGRRRYVMVNAPWTGNKAGGTFPVARLLPGVTSLDRVRYASADTLDLRRRNLVVEPIQDGRCRVPRRPRPV